MLSWIRSRRQSRTWAGSLILLSLTLGLLLRAAFYPAATRATGEAEAAAAERMAYNREITARYQDRFTPGQHFLPSNVTTESGQFLDPKTFPTAAYCGHCHRDSHQQWRESAHSNSNRAPWYLRNVDLLKQQKGIEFTRHCEGCHDPVALVAGDLTPNLPAKRHGYDDDGVTCVVCHSIVRGDTRGTGSYMLGTPAVLVDENGAPMTRPIADAEILAHLDRHSAAVMKPFYKTSEFCASCHKAALPAQLNDYKWQRAISLYDEWQNSSFAEQSPLPFYQKAAVSTCQSCHMQREDLKLADPGAKHGQLASHRWLGANTLIPEYYHYDEQKRRTVAFLENSIFNVDLFAVEHRASPGSAPRLAAPFDRVADVITPGERLTVDVVIQNKGIAHSHVPEQRDMYQSWVDFTVKDRAGRTLGESGFVDPRSKELDPRAHSFTNRLINTDGGLNAEHQVWNTRVVAYTNSIQSGRSQVVRYTFTMPPAAAGPVTVTATVKYRRFNQHFIDFGMAESAGQHYPETTISMASASMTLAAGASSAHAPRPGENADWMRWNNFGIALLDAQQYAAALGAFSRVASMRPDYADAFTNRALAEFEWQRYAEAGTDLDHALALAPGNARALYYRALVERNQGNLDAAVGDLKQVLAAFPRSRDAHRELGFSYYQQHLYPAARAEYEALQAIDPDDLAAHYNLAILYRRLGLKDKAAVESAAFADQKDDPTASVYALSYLRHNPAVANESVAWHTHDLDAAVDTVTDPLPTKFSGTQQ